MPFGPGGPLLHRLALHPRREGGVHSISAGLRPSSSAACTNTTDYTLICRSPFSIEQPVHLA